MSTTSRQLWNEILQNNPSIPGAQKLTWSKNGKRTAKERKLNEKMVVKLGTKASLTIWLDKQYDEAQVCGVVDLSGRGMSVLPAEDPSVDLSDTVAIDISGNHLSSLPPSTSSMSLARELLVDHNCLRRNIESIDGMLCLQYVDMSHNDLMEFPPALCRLPIKILLLNGNRVPEIIAEVRLLAATLVELDVSNNSITTIPNEISQLANLRRLNLADNAICELPDGICELTLRHLDVSHNRLTRLPLDLRLMTRCRRLIIHHNPFNGRLAQMCEEGSAHIRKCLELEAGWRGKRCTVTREPLCRVAGPREIQTATTLSASSSSTSASSKTMGGVQCRERSTILGRIGGDSGYTTSTNGEDSLTGRASAEVSPKHTQLVAELPHRVDGQARGVGSQGGQTTIRKLGIPCKAKPLAPTTTPKDATKVVRPSVEAAKRKSPIATVRVKAALLPLPRVPIVRTLPSSGAVRGATHRPTTTATRTTTVPASTTTRITTVPAPTTTRTTTVPAPTTTRTTTVPAPTTTSVKKTTPTTTSTRRIAAPAMKKVSPAVSKTSSTTSLLRATVGVNKIVNNSIAATNTMKRASIKISPANGKASEPVKADNAADIKQPPSLLSVRPPRVAVVPPVIRVARRPPLTTSSSLSASAKQAILQQANANITIMREVLAMYLKVELREGREGVAAQLADGVLLCRMVNEVRARTITAIHTPIDEDTPLSPPKSRRNVENFVSASRRLGVAESSLCSVVDVMDKGNLPSIAATVAALHAKKSTPNTNAAR